MGDELIWIPSFDDKIITYNIKNGQQHIIRIPEVNVKQELCSGVCMCGNQIILFPKFSGNAVWSFDPARKYLKREDWLSRFFENEMPEQGLIIRVYVSQDDILCVAGGTYIWRINVNKREIKRMEINADVGSIIKVAFDGTDYWILLENSQDVLQWDGQNNSYVRYSPESEKWVDIHRQSPYGNIIFDGTEAYLVNHYASDVMKIDREERKIVKAFEEPSGYRIVKEMTWGGVFFGTEVYNNTLLFLPQRGNMMLMYNRTANYVEGIEFEIVKREIPYFNELFTERIKTERQISETEELYRLSGFLRSIEKKKASNERQENVGAAIYGEMISQSK